MHVFLVAIGGAEESFCFALYTVVTPGAVFIVIIIITRTASKFSRVS